MNPPKRCETQPRVAGVYGASQTGFQTVFQLRTSRIAAARFPADHDSATRAAVLVGGLQGLDDRDARTDERDAVPGFRPR